MCSLCGLHYVGMACAARKTLARMGDLYAVDRVEP